MLCLDCRKLYWVDSKHKTLDSVNINGNERTSVSLASVVGTGHVFGLTVDSGNAYISSWKSSASMIKVQLSNGSPAVYKSGLSSGAVFSNVYVSSQQPSGCTISFLYHELYSFMPSDLWTIVYELCNDYESC